MSVFYGIQILLSGDQLYEKLYSFISA